MTARANELGDDVTVTDSVLSRNQEAVEGSFISRSTVAFVLSVEIRVIIPLTEGVTSEIGEVFKTGVVGGNGVFNITKNSIKLAARIFSQCTTKSPDQGEDSEHVDLSSVIFTSRLRLELGALRKEGSSIRRSDGIEQASEGLNSIEVSGGEEFSAFSVSEFKNLGEIFVDEFLESGDGGFKAIVRSKVAQSDNSNALARS